MMILVKHCLLQVALTSGHPSFRSDHAVIKGGRDSVNTDQRASLSILLMRDHKRLVKGPCLNFRLLCDTREPDENEGVVSFGN